MSRSTEPDAAVAALARRLVPGSGELRLSLLTEGLVNDSYRVERDGAAYALRLRRGHAERRANPLGSDHFWEARVLAAAESLGLAPPILRCDPHSGVLLTRWCAGDAVAAARCPASMAAIAALIGRIQCVPIPASPRVMTPRAWCDLYAGGAAPDAMLLKLAAEKLRCLQSAPVQQTLCHSDLHRHNLLVQGDRSIVLDWEYAHVGDAWWDLAGWSCNNDFDADQSVELLEHRLGAAPSTAEVGRFAAVLWLYDFVCWSWARCYEVQRPDAAYRVAERTQLLSVRLASK